MRVVRDHDRSLDASEFTTCRTYITTCADVAAREVATVGGRMMFIAIVNVLTNSVANLAQDLKLAIRALRYRPLGVRPEGIA